MPRLAPGRAQPAQTVGLTHANEPATQTAAATRKAGRSPVRAPSRTNVRFAVTYAVKSVNKKAKMQKNNAKADATPKSPRAACPPEGREPPAPAGGRHKSDHAK